MQRLLLGLISAFLLFGITAVPSTYANGCGAAISTPEPTVQERVRAAAIILQGTVIQTEGRYPDYYTALVRVSQYLKGNGPALVRISGFHNLWTMTHCANPAEKGSNLIFFTNGEVNSTLSSSRIGVKRSTLGINPAIIAEATSAIGQMPVTPLPEIPTAAAATIQNSSTPDVMVPALAIFAGVSLGLAFLLITTLVIFLRMKQR
jgi:hypothetical protein